MRATGGPAPPLGRPPPAAPSPGPSPSPQRHHQLTSSPPCAFARYELFASRFVTSHIATTGTAVAHYLRRQADQQRARRACLLLTALQTRRDAAPAAAATEVATPAGGAAGSAVAARLGRLGAPRVRAGLRDLARLGLVRATPPPPPPPAAGASTADTAAEPAALAAAELAAYRQLSRGEMDAALRRSWGALLPAVGGADGPTADGGTGSVEQIARAAAAAPQAAATPEAARSDWADAVARSNTCPRPRCWVQ